MIRPNSVEPGSIVDLFFRQNRPKRAQIKSFGRATPPVLAGLSLQHPRVKYEERLQPPSPCRVRRLQPPMT